MLSFKWYSLLTVVSDQYGSGKVADFKWKTASGGRELS
jgi:hypothetical protein